MAGTGSGTRCSRSATLTNESVVVVERARVERQDAWPRPGSISRKYCGRTRPRSTDDPRVGAPVPRRARYAPTRVGDPHGRRVAVEGHISVSCPSGQQQAADDPSPAAPRTPGGHHRPARPPNAGRHPDAVGDDALASATPPSPTATSSHRTVRTTRADRATRPAPRRAAKEPAASARPRRRAPATWPGSRPASRCPRTTRRSARPGRCRGAGG